MADRDLARGIDVALLADGPVAGSFDGNDVVLVRHGGHVCALAATCTHLGAPLADGLVIDGEIRCPWHHARFSIESGEAIDAPAFAPLTRFSTREEGGSVRVTGRIGDAAPEPPAPRDIGRVVIVGGGAAGHACAEILARHGAGAGVTLLSNDADAPYDRTACSKAYLAGKQNRDDGALPSPSHGDASRAVVRTGVAVTSLDIAGGAVETATGERIHFDTLVLATGAEPVLADFDGADRDDVHTLRTLADADALIDAAGKAKAAVVLGASYIGLETAASLTQRGLAVTVVGDGEVPLGKTAGPEVGALVRSWHEDKGVSFRMGRKLARWDGSVATLDDGSTIDADFVVAGTGVAPRIELAEAAGLALAGEAAGGGVAVDATLRTSAPHIYAIGDIASVPDPRLGHPIRVEHWVVAQRQGQWLARHLLGETSGGYDAVPFFWSGHYDENLRYVGHVADTGDRAVDGDPAAGDVAVTFREDGAERAMLTCGRDRLALETEAAWER